MKGSADSEAWQSGGIGRHSFCTVLDEMGIVSSNKASLFFDMIVGHRGVVMSKADFFGRMRYADVKMDFRGSGDGVMEHNSEGRQSVTSCSDELAWNLDFNSSGRSLIPYRRDRLLRLDSGREARWKLQVRAAFIAMSGEHRQRFKEIRHHRALHELQQLDRCRRFVYLDKNSLTKRKGDVMRELEVASSVYDILGPLSSCSQTPKELSSFDLSKGQRVWAGETPWSGFEQTLAPSSLFFCSPEYSERSIPYQFHKDLPVLLSSAYSNYKTRRASRKIVKLWAQHPLRSFYDAWRSKWKVGKVEAKTGRQKADEEEEAEEIKPRVPLWRSIHGGLKDEEISELKRDLVANRAWDREMETALLEEDVAAIKSKSQPVKKAQQDDEASSALLLLRDPVPKGCWTSVEELLRSRPVWSYTSLLDSLHRQIDFFLSVKKVPSKMDLPPEPQLEDSQLPKRRTLVLHAPPPPPCDNRPELLPLTDLRQVPYDGPQFAAIPELELPQEEELPTFRPPVPRKVPKFEVLVVWVRSEWSKSVLRWNRFLNLIWQRTRILKKLRKHGKQLTIEYLLLPNTTRLKPYPVGVYRRPKKPVLQDENVVAEPPPKPPPLKRIPNFIYTPSASIPTRPMQPPLDMLMHRVLGEAPIFIVDFSGTMTGERERQLKELVACLLRPLGPVQRRTRMFEFLRFNEGYDAHGGDCPVGRRQSSSGESSRWKLPGWTEEKLRGVRGWIASSSTQKAVGEHEMICSRGARGMASRLLGALRAAAACSNSSEVWLLTDGDVDEPRKIESLVASLPHPPPPIHSVAFAPNDNGERFLRKMCSMTGGRLVLYEEGAGFEERVKRYDKEETNYRKSFESVMALEERKKAEKVAEHARMVEEIYRANEESVREYQGVLKRHEEDTRRMKEVKLKSIIEQNRKAMQEFAMQDKAARESAENIWRRRLADRTAENKEVKGLEEEEARRVSEQNLEKIVGMQRRHRAQVASIIRANQTLLVRAQAEHEAAVLDVKRMNEARRQEAMKEHMEEMARVQEHNAMVQRIRSEYDEEGRVLEALNVQGQQNLHKKFLEEEEEYAAKFGGRAMERYLSDILLDSEGRPHVAPPALTEEAVVRSSRAHGTGDEEKSEGEGVETFRGTGQPEVMEEVSYRGDLLFVLSDRRGEFVGGWKEGLGAWNLYVEILRRGRKFERDKLERFRKVVRVEQEIIRRLGEWVRNLERNFVKFFIPDESMDMHKADSRREFLANLRFHICGRREMLRAVTEWLLEVEEVLSLNSRLRRQAELSHRCLCNEIRRRDKAAKKEAADQHAKRMQAVVRHNAWVRKLERVRTAAEGEVQLCKFLVSVLRNMSAGIKGSATISPELLELLLQYVRGDLSQLALERSVLGLVGGKIGRAVMAWRKV